VLSALRRHRQRIVAFLAGGLVAGIGVLVAMNLMAGETRVDQRVNHLYAIDSPRFEKELGVFLGPSFVAGNQATILLNGDRIFPAMLGAIEGARQSITFETYIYWSGDIGRRFATALGDAARRGVPTHVLLDWVGASKMDDALLEEMKAAGVRVRKFHPPHWYNLGRMNNRTHRKLLVVDGRIGFTGGVGIAEEWTGNCQDTDHWRDTHLRIEGPAVRDLLGGFQQNWAETTRTVLTPDRLPELEPFDDGIPMHITRSSATHGSTEAEMLFFAVIAAAQKSLDITTAYFAPRDAVVDALIEAVSRGVEVRLLVNGPHGDKELVRQTGRRSYRSLLQGGVRIFEYQRTMVHAKIVTVDGVFASTGSINVDNRSFALNDELNASMFDPAVTAIFDEHFQNDLADAHEIDLGRWERRARRLRAVEGIGALVREEL
jgi:cardiolipin synthase A/B